jgi:hypothetical protein
MERRWVRRLGPGIAAIGAMAAVASTTAGAPPAVWDPPACTGAPTIGDAPLGAWFRLDPILAEGTYVGQWLSLGMPEDGTGRRLQLEPESFANGPTRGVVLVGVDDGRTSKLTLVDVAAACGWAVGASRDVIRNAIVDPTGGSIVESRVDRRTRTDLGIWRRGLDGATRVRILPPIGADDRFGPTWQTDLAWSDDGMTLVVGSCGEAACRYRLVSGAEGATATTTVSDPVVGALVGVADGRLVTRQACRGFPCAILSRPISGDAPIVLDDAAGLAVMARDERGRSVVVHEVAASDAKLWSIRPDGTEGRPLAAPPRGLRLVADSNSAASAVEHAVDSLLFGPDGRVAPDAGRATMVRPFLSDVARTLDEVTR